MANRRHATTRSPATSHASRVICTCRTRKVSLRPCRSARCGYARPAPPARPAPAVAAGCASSPPSRIRRSCAPSSPTSSWRRVLTPPAPPQLDHPAATPQPSPDSPLEGLPDRRRHRAARAAVCPTPAALDQVALRAHHPRRSRSQTALCQPRGQGQSPAALPPVARVEERRLALKFLMRTVAPRRDPEKKNGLQQCAQGLRARCRRNLQGRS